MKMIPGKSNFYFHLLLLNKKNSIEFFFVILFSGLDSYIMKIVLTTIVYGMKIMKRTQEGSHEHWNV